MDAGRLTLHHRELPVGLPGAVRQRQAMQAQAALDRLELRAAANQLRGQGGRDHFSSFAFQ